MKHRVATIMVLFGAIAFSLACQKNVAGPGDGGACQTLHDCGSGERCVVGKCEIVPGQSGQDAGPAADSGPGNADAGALDAGAPLDSGRSDGGSTAGSDAGLVVNLDGGMSVCIPPTQWWDPRWPNRRMLTIQEMSGTVLDKVTVIGAIAATDLGATSDDTFRIVHEGVPIDVHRMPNMAGWRVAFRLQGTLAANGSSSGYFLYFNNGDADAGPGPSHWADSMGADAMPSEVYLAAEDFQGHDAGTCPDGWQNCGANFEIGSDGANGVLVGLGNAGAYALSGNPLWGDIAVEGLFRVPGGSNAACPGLAVRVADQDNLVEVDFSCGGDVAAFNALLIWSLVAGDYALEAESALTYDTASWHHLSARANGQHLVGMMDGQNALAAELGDKMADAGMIGLYSGEEPSSPVWMDDVTVRQLVQPEPSVSLGPLEQICP